MNLLLFENSEMSGSLLHIGGRRAKHVYEILGCRRGDTIRVGILDGLQGVGTIINNTSTALEMEVCLQDQDLIKSETILILALPRPIMLQRILKQATVLGVKAIHLIRSQKVEKSFFQSPVLKDDKIKRLLIEGLEQAMDTVLPDVQIHRRFKPFMEDVLPQLSQHNCLIAHPVGNKKLFDLVSKSHDPDPLVLAIGPEGGWNEYELEKFHKAGFQGFSMGPRILHVDTAVVALLAQIKLLQDFFKR